MKMKIRIELVGTKEEVNPMIERLHANEALNSLDAKITIKKTIVKPKVKK